MERRKTSREKLLRRLRRIEGQIRGVQGMIANGRDCEEVLTQIMAARAALEQVAIALVNDHLEECLVDLDSRIAKDKLVKTIKLFLKRW